MLSNESNNKKKSIRKEKTQGAKRSRLTSAHWGQHVRQEELSKDVARGETNDARGYDGLLLGERGRN